MTARFACLAVCLALLTSSALAQPADSKSSERAARRAQLQLQALQQELQQAQAGKSKVEAEKAAADKALAQQTDEAGRARGQLQRTGASLKAAEAAREQLAANVAALEKQLADNKRSSDDALAAKDRELAALKKTRDEQQGDLQRRLDLQVAQVGECSAKNTRLIRLSSELVDRWRNKSVSDVVRQRDVVLGLSDVQMFNLVQDYRDKAEAERFAPSNPR